MNRRKTSHRMHECCTLPPNRRRGLSRLDVLITVGLVTLLAGLLIPAVHSAREAALTSACIGGNSKAFSLALHNYHDVHGTFPPAYVTGERNRPTHSWRVLLLPYLDLNDAYDRYDLTKPWDAAANRQLIDSRVDRPFKCPKAPPENATMTEFLAIVGRDTLWPEDGTCISFKDIPDGTANTILFAEVDTSGIHRAEPRDFHTLQMSFRVNSEFGQGISSPHRGIAFAAFADGSIKALRNGISEEVVRALVTRNGAERVKPRQEGRELY
jgi:hypothetical protein